MKAIKIKVPWLPYGSLAIALRPFIFYRGKMSQGLLRHELVHHAQQKEIGLIKYCWKFLRDEGFRYRVEREAYRVSRPDWTEDQINRHILKSYFVSWEVIHEEH